MQLLCGTWVRDQGSNPCLLHWQMDSLALSHQGSPYSECFDGIVTLLLPLLQPTRQVGLWRRVLVQDSALPSSGMSEVNHSPGDSPLGMHPPGILWATPSLPSRETLHFPLTCADKRFPFPCPPPLPYPATALQTPSWELSHPFCHFVLPASRG